MLEVYLGLLPGEEPIDRLVDGTIPDPALALDHAPNLVIDDPTTGAVLAVISRQAAPPAGAGASRRLWHRGVPFTRRVG
jgi:hypothetical protein